MIFQQKDPVELYLSNLQAQKKDALGYHKNKLDSLPSYVGNRAIQILSHRADEMDELF
jgi:hypothetical protein